MTDVKNALDIDESYFKLGDIRLEIYHDSHEKALCQLAQDPRIWVSHRGDYHKPEIYKVKRLEKAKKLVAEKTRCLFVVYYKNRVVGETSYYDISFKHKTLAIGFSWLHPDYWGKGINAKIKQLLLSYAFETLQFRRVSFCVDSENLQSRRAVEKLGIPFEGILKKHYIRPDGSSRDSAMYAITDDVYADLK